MCTLTRFVTFLFLVLSAGQLGIITGSPSVRLPKTVLDFTPWIPDFIVWIPVFVSGPWISDSNRLWYSRFLERYSGFQNPGFRIPGAKSSRITDSSGKISWISKRNLDSLSWGEQLCHDFLLLWLKHIKAHCNQIKPWNNGSVLFKISLLLNLNCKWMFLAFDSQDENGLLIEKDRPATFRV